MMIDIEYGNVNNIKALDTRYVPYACVGQEKGGGRTDEMKNDDGQKRDKWGGREYGRMEFGKRGEKKS